MSLWPKDPEARKAALVRWLRSCPFQAYSLGALEAAYDALVNDGDDEDAT